MKNQYFGDINDYRKYGLLRLLSGRGQIRTAVCWMLTADNGSSDGSRIDYLRSPLTVGGSTILISLRPWQQVCPTHQSVNWPGWKRRPSCPPPSIIRRF
jgi:hypothetical protein